MSIVKSLSVGNGDMFYIVHNTDSFTTIDCCMTDENKESIMDEIVKVSKGKGIQRFISTHPDDDHFRGIEYYDERTSIINFYCVENDATKTDETVSFKKYKELRDGPHSYFVRKGCTRKWLNQKNDERKGAGLHFLWPDVENAEYQAELERAKAGESPNNISLIVQYNCELKFLWLGDLETEFLEQVKDEIDFEQVDVVFAPHHGRKSGKIPKDILDVLNPQIVIIGEAKSKNLNYYSGYNTITQNSAGDIIFECIGKKVHIYVSNPNYSVDFLEDVLKGKEKSCENYIGSFSKR
ncbi:MAG: hypothetical protein HDT18_06360 [Oscillibacter sp.]|nr:hypothetical protein [Oscillibacter sp.]